MDKFRLDSHKLMYHPERVNAWLKGENIYPIYLEISPAGSCNHRCLCCALDFLGYQPKFLDSNVLRERVSEMGSLGVKSIVYAGEGEPFLHKDMVNIVKYTKAAGIDVAIATNAVLFNSRTAEDILADLTWLKVSINAGKKETYSKIHRTEFLDFDRVIKNMAYAAKIKEKKRYKCTLGMQIILLPENHREILLLAKKARDIGMDYLVVKPYSHHPFSKTKKYKNIRYNSYFGLAKELERLNDKKFNAIFRIYSMKKWDEAERNYRYCLASPFWSYIDVEGNVWFCNTYLSVNKFCFGNIYENTFREIWQSNKRLRVMQQAEKKLFITKCRINCRMNEVNRYLWELKNPPEHVNFI